MLIRKLLQKEGVQAGVLLYCLLMDVFNLDFSAEEHVRKEVVFFFFYLIVLWDVESHFYGILPWCLILYIVFA